MSSQLWWGDLGIHKLILGLVLLFLISLTLSAFLLTTNDFETRAKLATPICLNC